MSVLAPDSAAAGNLSHISLLSLVASQELPFKVLIIHTHHPLPLRPNLKHQIQREEQQGHPILAEVVEQEGVQHRPNPDPLPPRRPLLLLLLLQPLKLLITVIRVALVALLDQLELLRIHLNATAAIGVHLKLDARMLLILPFLAPLARARDPQGCSDLPAASALKTKSTGVAAAAGVVLGSLLTLLKAVIEI